MLLGLFALVTDAFAKLSHHRSAARPFSGRPLCGQRLDKGAIFSVRWDIESLSRDSRNGSSCTQTKTNSRLLLYQPKKGVGSVIKQQQEGSGSWAL
jgi:hypothetical protein